MSDPTKLSFPGGTVELEAGLFQPGDFGGTPPTTKEPELVNTVLARVMGELQALVEFTDDRGEWKQRVQRALRELDAAHYTAGALTWEPVKPEPMYLEEA